jgi:hypothetical protein
VSSSDLAIVTTGTLAVLLFCLLATSRQSSIWGLGLFAGVGVSPTLLNLTTLKASYANFLAPIFALTVVTLAVAQWTKSLKQDQDRSIGTKKKLLSLRSWTVLPAAYVATFTLFQSWAGIKGFNYLLNTWDGSSNSGLVRALEVNPGVTYTTALTTQWENYPNFAHQFPAMISRLLQDVLGDSPNTTLIVFGFFSTLVYSLLLLELGRTGFLLASKYGLGVSLSAVAGYVCQALFLTPRLITDLALMHSVSFMLALVAVLASVRTVISARSDSRPGDATLLTSGLCALLASGSYPLLVVIPLAVWAYLALQRRDENQTSTVISALMVALAIVLAYTSLSMNNSDSRFQATGHIYPLPKWTIPTLAIVVIFGLITKLITRTRCHADAVLLVLTGLCLAMSFYLWSSSPSRSRAYGENYYAKKFEYAVIAVLLPLAIPLLLNLCSTLVSVFRRRLKQSSASNIPFGRSLRWLMGSLCVALSVTSMLTSYLVPTVRDDRASLELRAALAEALRPGPGIVWSRHASAKSISPTLMANYLDKSLWRQPFLEDLNLRLFQSAQGNNTDQVSEAMCQVSARENMRTRITYLNPQEYEYCGG